MTNDAEKEKILTLRIDCLSGIAELEKECTKQGLTLSKGSQADLMRLTLQKLGADAAQKLIAKLVDKGKISWSDSQDFEVEAIVDFCLGDDDERLYLIKWRGWTSKYNSWEPEDNLNCRDLIGKFNEVHRRNSRKRKRVTVYDEPDDDLKTGRDRLDDLYRKIVKNCESLTPYQLLDLDGPIPSPDLKRYRDRGLVANVGENTPHQFKKMSGILARKWTKSYKEMKAESQKAIQDWEKQINEINSDPAPIYVENECDLEGPPAGFTYISDYISGPEIDLPNDPLVGCECTDCSSCRRSCCPANMGSEQPYNKYKKLRVEPGTPLYECNRRCACDKSCPNRVVQLGRKWKVTIFRTSNSRGWGVKTRQKIKKGAFVMEYVGEVITSEEAEARGKVYDSEGMTYLFDLDFNDGDNPYTVDARNFGNVSHFVNHSCEPNLAVYGVWINNLDPSLPRIALFARRDIEKGEELTFDYMMKIDHHTHIMSPLTTPDRKHSNGVVELECERRTNGVHEKAEDLVITLDSVDNVVKTVASQAHDKIRSVILGLVKLGNKRVEDKKLPIRENEGNRSAMKMVKQPESQESDVVEMDYSDFANNNATTPKKGDPSNDDLAYLDSTPEKQILPSMGRTPSSKSQAMGLRTPVGAKNRIKCQCGTKSCRGFLF